MKEVASSPWNYTVYLESSSGRNIITVIFFGAIDYPRSFYLSDNDVARAESIAEDIRSNYNKYVSVEVHPPVTRADS